MELTFESMFSPAGMLGNASYILLILSMAMRNMLWLRILAVFSGITGIIYDAFILHDPVGTFWESAFTLVNLIQWTWLSIEKRKLKLSSEERELKHKFFPHIDDTELKQLFNCSTFKNFTPDTKLTRQGEKVENLYMITEGKVDIHYKGELISSCKPGDLIGEIGFLTGSAASATATTATNCKLIEFNHNQLATLIKSSTEIATNVNDIINKALTDKLIRQNNLALTTEHG